MTLGKSIFHPLMGDYDTLMSQFKSALMCKTCGPFAELAPWSESTWGTLNPKPGKP